MNKRLLTYCLIYLLAGLSALQAQYFARLSQCATNPPDFSVLSYDEADRMVDKETRKKICFEYITNLVIQLRHDGLSNHKKVLVIYLLGELHSGDTNSIETLIEYIDLKATKQDEATRFIRWGHYPAEEALTKIGGPAVIPILGHLPAEGDPLRCHLMCDVLVRVEGKNGTRFNESAGKKIVQDQINRELGREADLAKRANLQAALTEVEHWKMPDPSH
jgi:hypothetical protein